MRVARRAAASLCASLCPRGPVRQGSLRPPARRAAVQYMYTAGGQRAGFGAQPAHIEPSLQSRGFLRRQPSPHNPISRFLLLGEASSYRTGSLRTGGRRTSRNEILRSWAVPRRWGPGIIKCESSTSAGASARSCGASRNLPACTTRAGSRRLSLSRPVVGSRGPPFFSRFLCARLLFPYGCLHFTFLGCPLRGFAVNPTEAR